jgi:hypothetical protein
MRRVAGHQLQGMVEIVASFIGGYHPWLTTEEQSTLGEIRQALSGMLDGIMQETTTNVRE